MTLGRSGAALPSADDKDLGLFFSLILTNFSPNKFCVVSAFFQQNIILLHCV
ncbi:hypothetical protein DPMN_022446 [Dreissena polymorpha]|uniref:Uncharacterized protein n=1 Tax=Dreissena polymorpha TaxID=45954 RepID=A0A9D4NQB6_DREPO|nr:hypothetical protein DPMN_022446 [Dreissena polymorpha]